MRLSVCATGAALLLLMGAFYAVPDDGEADTCRVRLTLVDAATGETLPGLIRVRGSDGEPIALEGLLPRGQGLGPGEAIQQWWALVEPSTVPLPRAVLEVAAFSGLETELATQTLDLRGRTQAELTIPLDRFYDARKAGYQNANTHVHVRKITRAESDRYLIESATADGLDLVFVSYLERAEDDVDYTSNQYTRPELQALSTPHVHFDHGEEHRHNFTGYGEGYGHVMLLSIPELVYPVSIGPGIAKTGTDGIPLRRGIERAQEIGGTVIWCHNDWGLEDTPNWLSGRLHANNIFDGGTHGSYAHSFYRYWNAGIKVPVSTGTDWFIYDFSRVYVPAASHITPEEWLQQLAAGRSYITNGPLLEFAVDGQGLGAELSLDAPRSVAVTGRAVGRLDFGRLELVQNGEVVRQAETRQQGGHYEAELEVGLHIDAPCWLALRTPPPSVPEDPRFASGTPENEYGRELFGHTSATFIDVAGRRIFERTAAESLLDDMRRSRPFIAQHGTFADESEQRAVLAVYDEAIAVMQARIDAFETLPVE